MIKLVINKCLLHSTNMYRIIVRIITLLHMQQVKLLLMI